MVATVADDVLVLESGIVCERGQTAIVLRDSQHPYTQRLLAAAPSVAEAVDQWYARRGQHHTQPPNDPDTASA